MAKRTKPRRPRFELTNAEPDGSFVIDRGHDKPLFGTDGHILSPEERENERPMAGPLAKSRRTKKGAPAPT
jgi:hypothetical protein